MFFFYFSTRLKELRLVMLRTFPKILSIPCNYKQQQYEKTAYSYHNVSDTNTTSPGL